MSTPEQRQKVELQRCLESFDDQFREWRARVERPEWSTHFSQVHAATRMLDGLRGQLKAALDTEVAAPGNAVDLSRIEPVVLSAWRVWEAFRSRLSQRQEEMFRAGLQAADELAWSIRQRFAVAPGVTLPTEPALCYLNGGVSPTALVRGVPFAEETVRGESVQKEAQEILKKLPVPLISLPWTEVFHAPSMVSIAHETGHVLEIDAGLENAVAGAVPVAAKDRQWQPWAKEIFADHIAMRACGAGFAVFLGDLLAPLKKRRLQPLPAYPAEYDTRLELCHAALEEMGHQKQAATLRAEWLALSGPSLIKTDTVQKARDVVRALGRLKTGEKTLAEVISYTEEDEQEVLRTMEDLRKNPSRVANQPAMRVAAAAARLFHEEPEFFNELARTQDIQTVMLRSSGGQGRRRAGRRVDLRRARTPAASQAGASEGFFDPHALLGAQLARDLMKTGRAGKKTPPAARSGKPAKPKKAVKAPQTARKPKRPKKRLKTP